MKTDPCNTRAVQTRRTICVSTRRCPDEGGLSGPRSVQILRGCWATAALIVLCFIACDGPPPPKAGEPAHGPVATKTIATHVAGNTNGSAFADIERRAETGDAAAQYHVGFSYYCGEGVSRDLIAAVKLFRKAANQNHPQAQYALGLCYADGRGVSKDATEAVGWFRKAADQNHAPSQGRLGYHYSTGFGVAKDEAEAVRWYRKAADQNDAMAQNELGLLSKTGRWVPKDEVEAVKWYRRAAVQGLAIAQHNLGVCLNKGDGVPRDEAEAVEWFRKAAAQGYSDAYTSLGVAYANGEGVEKDYAEANAWFRKAGDLGDATAQYNLGFMNSKGRGIPSEDHVEAAKWFRKAAEQGYAQGQNDLGFAYANGRGVTRDYAEANKWYRKAAEQGLAMAQSNLGALLFQGLGGGQDIVEAYRWYVLAAAQGESQAMEDLRKLEMLMTPEQLADAKSAASMRKPSLENSGPRNDSLAAATAKEANGPSINMSPTVMSIGRSFSKSVLEWDRLALVATLRVDQAVAGANTADASLWLPLSRFSHVLAQSIGHMAIAEAVAACADSPDNIRATRELLLFSYSGVLAELGVLDKALGDFQRHPYRRPNVPWAELEPYSKASADARTITGDAMARHFRGLGLGRDELSRVNEIASAWLRTLSPESPQRTQTTPAPGRKFGPSSDMLKKITTMGDAWKVNLAEWERVFPLAGSRLHETLVNGRYGGASNWGNIERFSVLGSKRLFGVWVVELLAACSKSSDDMRATDELLLAEYLGAIPTLKNLATALEEARKVMHFLTYIRSEDLELFEKVLVATAGPLDKGYFGCLNRLGLTKENQDQHQEKLGLIVSAWRGKMPGFGTDNPGK